jgi:hypothetical protein
VAKKRRTRPHPGRKARPESTPPRGARATPSRERAPVERLPWSLTRRHKLALIGIFLTGLASFVGLADGYDMLEEFALVPGALAIGGLLCGYALERDVLERDRGRALRFAGFGLLAPLAVGLVGYAALTPISVLMGLTAYRLGVGSVTPPAAVAALGTLLVVGGLESDPDSLNPAIVAYLVSAAALWPGAGVLLLTRGRR